MSHKYYTKTCSRIKDNVNYSVKENLRIESQAKLSEFTVYKINIKNRPFKYIKTRVCFDIRSAVTYCRRYDVTGDAILAIFSSLSRCES